MSLDKEKIREGLNRDWFLKQWINSKGSNKELIDYVAFLLSQVSSSAKREVIGEIMEELINGDLRNSFEKYFKKDNIDSDGNYLPRKSTTNRSGALAYFSNINAYLRELLQVITDK